MKFKGDKVTPTEGRLEGVHCIVTDVYMHGKQSKIVPITPRTRKVHPNNKEVADLGQWLSWDKLKDLERVG